MTGTRFQGSWKGLTNEDKITGAWCSMRTHFTNQNRLRDWPLRLHPSTFQNFDPFLNLFSLFLFLYWLMIRVVTTQISSQSPLSVRLRDRVNSRRLPSFLASIFGRRRGDGGSSFFQSTSINLDFRAAVYQPPRRSSPAFLFSTPSSSTDVFLSSFLSFFLFFAFVSSRACTTDFLGRLERRIIIHQGLCLILAR